MNNRFYYLIVLVGCMILNFSCSKEEEGTPLPPTITLEQESPIYQVKVGGTLTISGTGAMADYYSALYRGSAPWYNIRSQGKEPLPIRPGANRP